MSDTDDDRGVRLDPTELRWECRDYHSEKKRDHVRVVATFALDEVRAPRFIFVDVGSVEGVPADEAWEADFWLTRDQTLGLLAWLQMVIALWPAPEPE